MKKVVFASVLAIASSALCLLPAARGPGSGLAIGSDHDQRSSRIQRLYQRNWSIYACSQGRGDRELSAAVPE